MHVFRFLLPAAAVLGLMTPPDALAEDSNSAHGHRRSVVHARHGMVAASHPLAVQIGLDVLRDGGSAVDAAIATNAALGLLEQRQLLLHSLNVFVPDPMRIFEEITRFKIIQGQMPLEGLYTVEELEALMAAYLAWKAAIEPEETSLMGDPNEGQVILPVKELKPKYS